MDIKMKQELKRINDKLNKLNTKLDKSTRDSGIYNYAVVGFSIFMLGIAIWLQQGMLTFTGNFFVIYGIIIVAIMYLVQKRAVTRRAKWGLVILALIFLGILQFINFTFTHSI